MSTFRTQWLAPLVALAVLLPPQVTDTPAWGKKLAVPVAMGQPPAGTAGKRGLHLPRTNRVSFTRVLDDGGGFRWDIQHYGNIGQGTNYAYSSGLYCQVNGSNIRSSGNGWINAAGDEIEIGPDNRNNLRCYRRVKVYKDRPLARWLDIFENPGGQDITVSIKIYTNTNYGIAQTITSSKTGAFGPKDWAFITVPQGGNNVPSLLHIVCGKRTKKNRPSVQIRGNQIYVNWSLTVPAGKTVVLCYFESQGRSIEKQQAMLKSFRAYKLMRDLSPAVRKLIINFPTSMGFEGIELERSESADTIMLANGDVLRGQVTNASFDVETFFGKLTLPADQVIGMVGGSGPGGGVLAALKDGQIVVGRPLAEKIELKLVASGSLQIPCDRIKQWSYRISGERPDEIPFDGPFLVLRTGDRLAFDPASVKLQLRTRHGVVPLAPEALLRVRMDNPAGAVHRADFVNGSNLAGMLLPRQISVKLRLGSPLDLSRDLIAQVQFAPEEKINESLTRAELSNGDQLFGKLIDERIRISTEYGDVDVATNSVRTITLSRSQLGRAVLQLWDETALRGQLGTDELTFKVEPGPSMKIYVGQLVSVVRSQALPPDQIVQAAEKLIPRLGAESFEDRQAATEELIKLGPGILPILRKHLTNRDPEIRRRVQEAIEKLEGQSSLPGPTRGMGFFEK